MAVFSILVEGPVSPQTPTSPVGTSDQQNTVVTKDTAATTTAVIDDDDDDLFKEN